MTSPSRAKRRRQGRPCRRRFRSVAATRARGRNRRTCPVASPHGPPPGAPVHLKSLTLKGFKSFASATTLRLEPGITCVVGPNGSGKSNVVDAISWVLGEQGAKALRGGKMEDVIFAGTSGRAPLGRAEVTLTIDNSDGALPIDYSEVSITRRMFRDGAGEYEINGSACRLLDIQELLCDSGIGREMHVVVGQGQLDSVLQSRPEDRRAYIEEAAGVLKHRKRKEKALRKLDAMQANLTRLTDLTGELRRQLKPLGRQAEIARRAQAVQSELRDARLRLAADDLVTLRDELAREEADEAAARARRLEVEEQLAVARAEQERLEARARAGRAAAGRRPGHLVPALRAGRAAARHRPAGAGARAAPGRPGRRAGAGPRPGRAGGRGRGRRRAGGGAGRGRRRRPAAARRGAGGARRARGDAGRRGARAPRRRPGAGRPPGRARDAGRAGRGAAQRRSRRPPRRSSGCPRRWPRRTTARGRRRSELEAAREATGRGRPRRTPAWRQRVHGGRRRRTRRRGPGCAELVARERGRRAAAGALAGPGRGAVGRARRGATARARCWATARRTASSAPWPG